MTTPQGGGLGTDRPLGIRRHPDDLAVIDGKDTRVAIESSLLPPLFDQPGVAVVAIDVHGEVTALSPGGELLLGFAEADLLGACFHERFHHRRPDGSPLPADECPLGRLIAAGRAGEGRGEVFVRRDGGTVQVAWAVAPVVVAGVRTGAVLAFYDTQNPRSTAPRNAARLEALQAANTRLALLADASHALISAADVRSGLAQVAGLLVPVAADGVVLDLLDEHSGRIERAALAHRNRRLEATGRARLGDLPRLRPEMSGPVARVLRGSDAVHLTVLPPVEQAGDELEAAKLELFHLLGAAEVITAPMRTRSRTVGSITLMRGAASRRYQPGDLPFVTELATRAAFATENAALREQYERRALTMQRTLLPDVPTSIGEVRLGHLYRPADDLLQVGGDWYDAFCLSDASIGLVIGDVMGHDMAAATRMGAIRHQLRGIAADRRAPPGQVLRRLDTVVRTVSPDDLATLIYARLTRHRRGGGTEWVLEWSSAGHPPPLLLAPSAEPVPLDTEPDLPIGVAPTERTGQRLVLPDGATVVLFTDGLIERAGEPLTIGLARLRREAARLPSVEVDTLPERLIDAVRPDSSDDIAILAVQVP